MFIFWDQMPSSKSTAYARIPFIPWISKEKEWYSNILVVEYNVGEFTLAAGELKFQNNLGILYIYTNGYLLLNCIHNNTSIFENCLIP